MTDYIDPTDDNTADPRRWKAGREVYLDAAGLRQEGPMHILDENGTIAHDLATGHAFEPMGDQRFGVAWFRHCDACLAAVPQG
ncbi:hypothetical protein Q5530_05530 [Saccharothrix sp. BKS2]|uniref:hypothetical protein n=1 Tax=Saccharothrix sp. BKS2 TaxID=3064400 RepID=UPI0039E89B54